MARTKWYEYAIRFGFGGAVTVLAGLIAKQYGPVLGGVFLAFPAIFPSGATLVEKHEREKKQKLGMHGAIRGRQAAALDAAGAAMGSVGLVCFALIMWKVLGAMNAAFALALASGAWLGTSVLVWRVLKGHSWR